MIELHDLTSLEQLRDVVGLEKLVWGYTDAEDVVPVPILAVTVKRGGILVGAFDGGRMVGFVYSMAGLRDGKPTQWSHMLGVLPEYRNAGLGHQLKLAQRQRALGMGLDLIEWTYDPLQAMNAHLNFMKLGIVVTEYEENIYGESSSPLHRGTPTDRFVAEWWIRSPRVERRLASGGAPAREESAGAVLVNRAHLTGKWWECGAADLGLPAPRLLVEIPIGFTEMLEHEPELARAWRFKAREIFAHYFHAGYTAIDFLLDRGQGKGAYLLVKEQPRSV